MSTKQTNSTRQVIKCPHCGKEYLPGEIFIPGELIGQPETIVRDALGKIIYEDYKEDQEPTFIEHFECEECGKPFVVEATVSYKVKKEEEELDFSNQYTSLLD